MPCSRCVGKQIVCQSRATRRSSQNPNRRGTLPRAHSERTLHTSAAFHVTQLSQFSTPSNHGQDMPHLSPSEYLSADTSPQLMMYTANMSPRGHGHPHRHSIPDLSHIQPVQITSAMLGPETDAQMLRNSYGHTPPDMNYPITPMMPNMPQMEAFMPMNGTHYDPEGDSQFLNMSTHNGLMEFDASTILTDFMSPPSVLQDPNDHFFMNGKGVVHTPNQIPVSMPGSATQHSRVDLESPPQHVPYRSSSGPSPSASSMSSRLQEPDAVLASHQAWPFLSLSIRHLFDDFLVHKAAQTLSTDCNRGQRLC